MWPNYTPVSLITQSMCTLTVLKIQFKLFCLLLLTLKMVFLKQQSTKESLGLSLHYFKKPIIRHQSIYVIRKSLPLQSKLSSLHTVITGTKSIFNHFTDWAHQLCGNIVTCLLCKSNIWAKTITLCLLQYSLNLFFFLCKFFF